jgi:single-strand DNA-binding protein
VVEIGLAVNHKYTDKVTNVLVEKVCFVDCRCIGKQAETINKYLSKGRPILVEGRLEFDQWEAQDGSKRSKHRVFIERFTFVDSTPGQNQTEQGSSQQQAPSPQAPPYEYQQQGPPSDMTGEDVPF